jgi:isopenicillin N synthase-like dioxygenase
MSIPVFDMATPHAQLATQLDTACTEVGFFAITGHGVDPAIVGNAWDEMVAFFALDDVVKMAARHPTQEHHPYGYFPPGQEALAASLGLETPADLKESFNMAPPPHHVDGTGRFGGVDRIWPDASPAFQRAWSAYYDAMAGLADRLLALMATGLGIDGVHFSRAVDRHLSALRGLHYPPLTSAPLPGQLRAGVHSDYGTLTILLPGPGTGGLEVLRADDTWVHVQPIDDGFVVNLGDMMAQWTNDRWRSTRHRVVIPDPAEAATEDRYSMAFFHHPNWDARIAPISTCVTSGNPARYEPVLAGPWLGAKFDATSTGP